LGKEQKKAEARVEADKLKSNEPAPLGTMSNKEAPQEELSGSALQKRADEGDQKLVFRKKDSSTRAAPEPSAALAPSADAVEPVGGALKSVLDRYGLPPVWGPGVSDEMVLKAEPALRNLYRVGGAATAADSARVRLYVAEAIRARVGAAPDSAAVDEIVHHYRRAIRLAGNDAEIRRVATERLADFLNELGDEPALHPPEGEGGQP